jgi:hypothetical protein
MRTRAPMCRSVGFGAFFAAVIAMADCSRKAMSKNRPDRGTADSLPGLFAKPRTIVGCTRLSCLNFWIRHADSEWGALTGCWFSGSLAPTPLDTVPMASWSEEQLETVQMTWQLRCGASRFRSSISSASIASFGRDVRLLVASPG